MRIFTVLLTLFVFIPVFASVPVHAAQEEEVYVCPMHPHITGKKGDVCPICGMTLVPKSGAPPELRKQEEREAKNTGDKDAALHIDPVYLQALGVRTAEVTHRVFGKEIRAFGNVMPSTRDEYRVAVRTGGLVRELKTAAVGDRVKKGDLLFTLYSPELVVAQQDYLSRATAGAHRLRILGMDDDAIALLDRERKILYDTPFHAPADGTVTTLDIRKGASVEEGETVLTIQDFSRVWIDAQIPEKDLRLISMQTNAVVEDPESGFSRAANIDYIAPELDEKTRTGTVRLVLDNVDGVLRPGRYVDAVFAENETERLSVPSAAILRDGGGNHVIRALGDGYFESEAVETGLSSDGYTEILSGLSHGDSVVENGQFLIDAEGTLRGGTAQMHGPETGVTEEGAQLLPSGHGGGHVH